MMRILLLILIFVVSVSAQNRIQDAGAWLSVAASYKVNQGQELTAMGRIRQYENFTRLNSWYIDVGYAYRFTENFKMSLHYAFNPSVAVQNYFRTIHQYYSRMDYRKFMNKYLTFHNRIILQHSTHRFLTDFTDNGYKPYYRTDFRERLGASYNLSATSEIYVHNEWMFTLSQSPIELRRNRLYVGYEKQYSKKWAVKYYFVLQSSFHKRKSPDRDFFIFGIDMNFELN